MDLCSGLEIACACKGAHYTHVCHKTVYKNIDQAQLRAELYRLELRLALKSLFQGLLMFDMVDTAFSY